MLIAEFILMLSGALIWTGIMCGVVAFLIHKILLEDE